MTKATNERISFDVPVDIQMLNKLIALCSTEMNVGRRSYHWQNAANYNAAFAADPYAFNPKRMKRILELAKLGIRYERFLGDSLYE